MNEPLPKGYNLVKFGEVVEEIRLYEKQPLENGLERYVGLDHLDSDSLQIKRWGLIKEGTTFTKKFIKGQVLFGRRRAYQRKTAIADFDGLCSGDIMIFSAKNGLIPELLPFIIQSEKFFDLALDTSAGSLSPRTKWSHLAEFKFPLPPRTIQKRMANLLWAVEDTINQVENAVTNEEIFKRVLMHHLFTYGAINVKKNKTRRRKKTAIGMMPENWKIKKLGDISQIRRGASPRPIGDSNYFSDTGPGWVRISDVTASNKYLRKTSQYLSPLGAEKSIRVHPGDIIMSICATIGKPILIDMDACIHDGFVLFENLSEDIESHYLFYLLSLYEKKFINKKQPGTQGNLNIGIVEKTIIPIPPKDEQISIINLLEQIDIFLDDLKKNAKLKSELKHHLLNYLLSGKVFLGGNI
jgi:type I restriction enzyme, S subunit